MLADSFIYLFGVLRHFQHCTRRVVRRAEETSTYSSSGFCTVNCRPAASNYQLSHFRPCREPNPGLKGVCVCGWGGGGGGGGVLPLCHRGPCLLIQVWRQTCLKLDWAPVQFDIKRGGGATVSWTSPGPSNQHCIVVMNQTTVMTVNLF